MAPKNLGIILLFFISFFTPGPTYARRRQAHANILEPDLVVGNGPGNIPTVTEAIAAAVQKRTTHRRFVIKITAGTYNENVVIDDDRLSNLTLVGDGKGKTIITGSRSASQETSTFDTATVGVNAFGFVAQGITFRNTAGPGSGQAVALRVGSDESVIYDCSIEGYQDTLYVHDGRQFYKNCDIYGTVDFIFGDAKAVFQDCNIYARKPNNGLVVIAASKRDTLATQTGIVIQSCRILPEPGANLEGVKAYLGRPWGLYSRTVIMDTNIGSFIDPTGWLWWEGKSKNYQGKIFYGEYRNSGPGSSTAGRVKWGGFHALTTPQDVMRFTVGKYINGNSWLPSTGVPYNPGL